MKHSLFLLLLFTAPICFTAARTVSPYAALSIGTTPGGEQYGHLSYDSAGNRLSNGQGQQIVMGLVTKPTMIRNADSTNEVIHHGPRGKRYLRRNAQHERILYVGDMEYRMSDSGNLIERVVYIRNGHYYPIAQVNTTTATPTYVYWLRDHLGSGLRKVDDTGSSVDGTRYDAWGTPTAATGVKVPQDKHHRGFTGHENIPSAEMIDMNARLFALDSSAFLGPDWVIQYPNRLPSLNRYCYGRNSPLAGTDPSGNVFIYEHDILTFTVPRNASNSVSAHSDYAVDAEFIFEMDIGELFEFNRFGTARQFDFRLNGEQDIHVSTDVIRNPQGYLSILLAQFDFSIMSDPHTPVARNVRTEFLADIIRRGSSPLEGINYELSFSLGINLTQSFYAGSDAYQILDRNMDIHFPTEHLRNQVVDAIVMGSPFEREVAAAAHNYTIVGRRVRRLEDGDLVARFDFERRQFSRTGSRSPSRPVSEISIPRQQPRHSAPAALKRRRIPVRE